MLSRTVLKSGAGVWSIIVAVMMPAAGEAQFWKKFLDEGEKIIEKKIDGMTPQSEEQQLPPTPQQQPEPAGGKQQQFSTAQVRQAQNYLTELGYNPGPVDGVFGGTMANAIKAYQGDHGLLQTGEPSDELLAHMRDALYRQGAGLGSKPPSQAGTGHGVPTASQQGSGMFLSAPGGAPVTVSQAPSARQTQKTVPTIVGLDPLAPAGVRLGVKLSVADDALNVAGYRKIGTCQYFKRQDAGNISLKLAAGEECDPDAPLVHINYRQTGVPIVETPPEMVGRISSILGQNGQCPNLREDSAVCYWHYSPNAPLVEQVYLNYGIHSPSLNYTLAALKDPSAYRPILSPDGDYDYPDPIAPANIAIGLMADEVRERLRKAHFNKMAYPDNEYMLKDRKSGERTTVQVWFGENQSERFDGQVSQVKYRTTRVKYIKAAESFIKQWNEKLGASGNCTSDNTTVTCKWLSPPAAPNVQEVLLRADTGGKPELVLIVQAMPNLGDQALKEKMDTNVGKEAPGASSFNPFSHYGVQIGMEFGEAIEELKSRGFKQYGRGCEYRKGTYSKYIGVSLETTSRIHPKCFEGEPVSLILTWGWQEEGSLKDLLRDAEKHIGAEASCRDITDSYLTDCVWNSFPNAPLVKRVYLRGPKTRLELSLQSVDNLDEIVKLPSKEPMPLSDQNWWIRELAEAEAGAQTVKFTGSEKFAGLSPNDQERLGEEAEYVYDYCNKRELFSSFHDCRCVAGEFIDERLAREEALNMASPIKGPGQETSMDVNLISIADDVADQCPNKPGAAEYGYNQCKKLYHWKLSEDDLEAFCTCYADTFAAMYMNDPRSFMPHITGIGSASALECTDRGYPSPLNR